METLSNPITLFVLFVAAFALGAWWKINKTGNQPPRDEERKTQLNTGLLAVLGAVGVLFFQLPSLSIDVNAIFGYAFDVVNAFMPLIAIIGGLGLGFNLIGKISALFSRAI